jgi:hypothetical protein
MVTQMTFLPASHTLTLFYKLFLLMLLLISMEIKHVVLIKTTKCNQTTKNPGKNENLDIWVNALKIGKMQRP